MSKEQAAVVGGELRGRKEAIILRGGKKRTVDSAGGRSAAFSFSSWKVVVKKKKSADRLETNWLSDFLLGKIKWLRYAFCS